MLSVEENQNIFRQQFSSYFKEEAKDLSEAKEIMAVADRKSQENYLEQRFGISLKFVQG